MYFGVHFGAQRGFVFCRGRTNSQYMGVTTGGFKGCLATFPGNWPFSSFVFFLRALNLLKPPSLEPPSLGHI